MQIVIIESPFAGDKLKNITYARRCLRDSLRRGEAPFASHLLYTQPGVLDDDKPEQRAWGIRAGLALSERADLVAFYTDCGWSPGMIDAWKDAKSKKKEFVFRSIHGTGFVLPPESFYRAIDSTQIGD